MDYDEAKHLLLIHGPGTTNAAGEPLVQWDGFTASLRPYSGLHEKNFHLIMEALLTAGERIYQASTVERDLVHAIWEICSTSRGWGLHPEGMLQRNELISPADSVRLETWIDTIEQATLTLLGGRPPHHAIFQYADYITETGWWENIGFFLPLMERAVSDPTHTSSIGIVLDALAKLGDLANSTLPTLYAARQRSYTWYIPQERCNRETHEQILRTIRAIEAGSHNGRRFNAADRAIDLERPAGDT